MQEESSRRWRRRLFVLPKTLR